LQDRRNRAQALRVGNQLIVLGTGAALWRGNHPCPDTQAQRQSRGRTIGGWVGNMAVHCPMKCQVNGLPYTPLLW